MRCLLAGNLRDSRLIERTYMLPRKRSWRGRASGAHANHTRQTRQCQQSGRDGRTALGTYTASVSPAAGLVFDRLGGLPFPSPFKGDRGAATGGVVPDKSDVVVFVEVRVGKKLSGDEILDFA